MPQEQTATLSALSKGMETIAKAVGAAKTKINDTAEAAIGGASAALETIGKVPQSFQAVSDSVTNLQAGIIGVKDSFFALSAGIDSISEVTAAVGSLQQVVGSASSALSAMNQAAGSLKSPLAIVATVIALLYATNDEFRESINELVGVVLSSLAPVMDDITGVFNVLAGIGAQLLEMAAGIAVPLLKLITPLIAAILTAVMPLISALLSLLTDVLGALMPVLTVLLTSLLEPLTPILQLIAGVLSGVLLTAFEQIGKILETVVVPILNAVGKCIQFLCSLFEGDFTKAAELFRSLFVNIANGVLKVIAGIVQKIINGVASIINFFIDMINGVISLLNKIPFVNIKAVGHVDWSHATDNWKIPAMATGGVIERATVAMVGEGAYPEAVIPLGNSPQFNSMKTEIANAVLQGLAAAQSPRAEGNTELVLNLDGERFARAIIPKINRENSRKGYALQLKGV